MRSKRTANSGGRAPRGPICLWPNLLHTVLIEHEFTIWSKSGCGSHKVDAQHALETKCYTFQPTYCMFSFENRPSPMPSNQVLYSSFLDNTPNLVDISVLALPIFNPFSSENAATSKSSPPKQDTNEANLTSKIKPKRTQAKFASHGDQLFMLHAFGIPEHKDGKQLGSPDGAGRSSDPTGE